jgi:hypothetical protein
MSIPQPKFEVGQKVINVRVTWSERKVACPDCLGKRAWRVLAPSGEEWEVPCNTCVRGWSSSGTVSEYGDRITQATLTIGSVRIDTASRSNPVTYMCEETGVGTGTVHDERDMFATQAEADAFGEAELARVKGLRQAQEDRERAYNKKERGVYKPSKAEGA